MVCKCLNEGVAIFYEWKEHRCHSGLENCQYNDSKDKGIDWSFPSCEPDILLNNCPIISRPLLEYISICMQINAAPREAGRVGGEGKWPLPHSRDTTSGNDECGRQGTFITADFINHSVKYQRAVERWGSLDVCVGFDLPRAKNVHVDDLHIVMEIFKCFSLFFWQKSPLCKKVYLKIASESMDILS